MKKIFKTTNMGIDAIIVLDKLCYARENICEGCPDIALGFVNRKDEVHFLYSTNAERHIEFIKLCEVLEDEK